MFNKKLFEEVNGYPNNFWGWGGEDDALLNRLINAGHNDVYYPKNGAIIDFEENVKMTTINNIGEKVKAEKKDLLKFEKLYEDLTSWKENGINSLQYKILNKDEINKNTFQIKVDLQKIKDEKKYPQWYPKSEGINYKILEHEVKKKWYNNIKISNLL